MANVDHTLSQLTPFRTEHEQHFAICGFKDGMQPALLVNPEATPAAIIMALQSRAATIHKDLFSWAISNETEATAADLAATLEPRVQEVVMLLDALAKMDVL